MKRHIIVITILFWTNLTYAQSSIKTDCKSQFDSISNRTIYTVVDSPPQFPGGTDSLIKFINNNLNIPFKSDIYGTVFISVIVEMDGSLTNARILHGIGGGCDEEALRVVNKMPKWKPGKCKAKMVPTYFYLPIKLKIQ